MDISKIVTTWNAHFLHNPKKLCVYDIHKEQAYSWADIKALVQMYRQQLQQANLSTGQRVVVRDAASANWVAKLWACWEEHVTFVPVPPSVPIELAQERIDFAQAHAVWGEQLTPHTINAERNEEAAYLIFTSGSSGTPKGVLVEGLALNDVWEEQRSMFRITSDSHCMWVLDPSFDASLSDVGVALTANAPLFIASLKKWRTYHSWADDMSRHRITHMDAPPSWLYLWRKHTPPASLEVIIAGGEPTDEELLKAWSDRVTWINVYGPTETTICSSAELRTPSNTQASIGQPFKHVLYKMDTTNELLIGGTAVAMQYWRQPQLTQERFIEGDVRWFRTGDLVEQHGDAWVYLGRIDRQQKVNGQLINWDGVEDTLSSFSEDIKVVVVTGQHVAAFVCGEVDLQQLKQFAQQKLPAWGVPKVWRAIEQFPLNNNGKIDRNALADIMKRHSHKNNNEH